ncbi:MAG: hypothetical protein U1C46_01830 [Bacteroidales bacterium]|nr:hypothetical protein [Bacteroidales bacterium]MDZ4203534.1 hypothetical protein [Bacteroidales bacterium]
MRKNVSANQLNFAFFLISLFLSLMIKLNPPVWIGYGDPYDYLHYSHMPVSEKEFFFPQKTPNHYPRPFTIPLFYKIAGSDPDTIIQMQKFFHALSTWFLCFVVLLFLNKPFARIFFVVFWYLLMSWWNILGWTHTLLSESLAMSLLFFWFGSFLLFYHKRRILYLIFHLIIAVLFSFTRDSWPYFLIIFYLQILLVTFFWEKKLRVSVIACLILSIGVFIVQQRSAQIGQRYRLPVMNNIVLRVLPNDQYLQWFADKGMPCVNELKENFSTIEDWKQVYSLYNDSAYIDFSNWITDNGYSLYAKFLLTHPSALLLMNEKKSDLKRIFACNIGYTGAVKGYSWISQYVFPLFNSLAIIALNFLLLYFTVRQKKLFTVFPTVLIFLFGANAMLLYLADALEVERHLFITNIGIQFIGILLVSQMLNSDCLAGTLRSLPGIRRLDSYFNKPKNNTQR